MRRRLLISLALAMRLVWCAPLDAAAQATASPASDPPEPTHESAAESRASDLWLTAGTTFATLRGDCQECEQDFPYRHAGGVLANIGYRVTDRMDVGSEIFWMPVDTVQGQTRTTHIDAVAQFRPWRTQGFFVKGGAGMAFVRNWVDTISSSAFNQKALSVVIGGGWAFRPTERVGFQVFGSQHVAALGDFRTPDKNVTDVVGNFWSLGAAIVIR